MNTLVLILLLVGSAMAVAAGWVAESWLKLWQWAILSFLLLGGSALIGLALRLSE